jgi:Caspase domain
VAFGLRGMRNRFVVRFVPVAISAMLYSLRMNKRQEIDQSDRSKTLGRLAFEVRATSAVDHRSKGVSMSSFRLLILLIFSICLGSSMALAEKRVALVIGNSTYQKVPGLPNPANDAAALATMFKAANFDSVESKFDLPAAELRKTLRDFAGKTRDADIAVIYYAGHGIELDGMNYLIPVDAALETDGDVLDETVPLERVLFAVEPARELRLIILDACRDNPFVNRMRRTISSRSIWRGLAKVEPVTPNTLIAFAAKAGSTASDGDSKNSPFATALVEYLPRPGLDIRRAFGFVRDDVLMKTSNKQEPYVYGSLGGGDVPLVPARPSAVAPSAYPQSAVRRDYELALQLATRDGWESFLVQYPEGFYSNLAKGQLNKIAAEEKRAATAEKARLAEKGHLDKEKAAVVEKGQLAGGRPWEEKKQQVAALGNSEQIDNELPRALQAELRRVGCNTGSVDGNWNASSQMALDLFNKNTGSKLDTKSASANALNAVKSKVGRICPVTCEAGYRGDGDHCVKIVCGSGYVLTRENICAKAEAKRVAGRHQETPTRTVETPAPTSGVARADAAFNSGSYKACMGARSGCYGRATQIEGMTPGQARTWCNRRPTC